MYDFPFDDALDSIRMVLKSTWNIPDGNPIAESGNNYLNTPSFGNLPMVLMEAEGEAAIEEGGERQLAALDLIETFTYYFWLIEPTSENTDDRLLLEQKLEALVTVLYNDRKLSGTVTELEIIEKDTSGTQRPFPGQSDPGTGIQYGYLGVKFTLVDQ